MVVILLVGCQSLQQKPKQVDTQEWSYADLRLLDPVDAVPAYQDLIALYTRMEAESFLVRIDFLDLGETSADDVYLPIDTHPGGLSEIKTGPNGNLPVDIDWDYLVKISSSGNVEIMDSRYSAVYNVNLLVVRDRSRDSLILRFNRHTLTIGLATTHLQVLIAQPGENKILDRSEVFSPDTTSPARAKVVFAFWNTFNPATPASTLRSWAGAHSGPMRERHGLSYLLDAATKTHTPILLADIMRPEVLSALDYIGALPQLRAMIGEEILAAPELSDSHVDGLTWLQSFVPHNNFLDSNLILELDKNQKTTKNANDRNSENIFVNDNLSLLYRLDNDFGDYDYAHYSKDCPIIGFHNNSTNNFQSFDEMCRKTLLSAAIELPNLPIVLGGDFANSILGDPAVFFEVIDFITKHPWITVMTLDDIRTYLNSSASNQIRLLNDGAEVTGNTIDSTSTIYTQLETALKKAPDILISELANQTYARLVSPAPAASAALRSKYIVQVGELIAAAQWAESPAEIVTCDVDLDYDSSHECILANRSIFAIVEPEGGYIPFVFTRDTHGIHQLIGPTWQFIVGLSDASVWNPENGVRGDPDQILGAFSDRYTEWNNYSVEIDGTKLVMERSDMAIRKTITINSDRLSVDIEEHTTSPVSASIPLVVDPWRRFTPGWGDLYYNASTSSSFVWGVRSGTAIEIVSSAPMESYAFNVSRAAMLQPEDPNRDYTHGHYLPYPMALVEITSSEHYTVTITIKP